MRTSSWHGEQTGRQAKFLEDLRASFLKLVDVKGFCSSLVFSRLSVFIIILKGCPWQGFWYGNSVDRKMHHSSKHSKLSPFALI